MSAPTDSLLEVLLHLSSASIDIATSHDSLALVIEDKSLASWNRAKLIRAKQLLAEVARSIQPKPIAETQSLNQWSDETQATEKTANGIY